MAQEEYELLKELLLKDLCARLSYGVKILDIPANAVGKLFLISTTGTVQYETADDTRIQTLYNIKPYLLPLSSMTEEQEREYNNLNCYELGCFPHSEEALDYLTKNYFDYRGLIEKGLAINATGLNIY